MLFVLHFKYQQQERVLELIKYGGAKKNKISLYFVWFLLYGEMETHNANISVVDNMFFCWSHELLLFLENKLMDIKEKSQRTQFKRIHKSNGCW